MKDTQEKLRRGLAALADDALFELAARDLGVKGPSSMGLVAVFQAAGAEKVREWLVLAFGAALDKSEHPNMKSLFRGFAAKIGDVKKAAELEQKMVDAATAEAADVDTA